MTDTVRASERRAASTARQGSAATGNGSLLGGMGLEVQRTELIDTEHDVRVAPTSIRLVISKVI